MSRLISIGLAIAVAPAILLAIGLWIESTDTVHVSEVALFTIAIPLGGLLVIAGLCKTAINVMRPSQLPLAQKATTQGDMLKIKRVSLRFWRWLGTLRLSITNITPARVDLLEIRRVPLKLWRWLLNGCYTGYVTLYKLAKNGAFWRKMLHDGITCMATFIPQFLSQLVPFLLTGVLGLFVAGAVYLPIAFDHVARVLLTLGGMSLVYGSESVIRLGHVQVCSQIGFSAPTCIHHDLGVPALILWVGFYALWIWRRRLKINKMFAA